MNNDPLADYLQFIISNPMIVALKAEIQRCVPSNKPLYLVIGPDCVKLLERHELAITSHDLLLFEKPCNLNLYVLKKEYRTRQICSRLIGC
jgi:hypothetical protein